MSGPGSYTFEGVDFFTDEPRTFGRLELEQHGRRWVLLVMRAESTGGRWVATWCGAGDAADAEQLPAGLELAAELVELVERAPRVDARELGADASARARPTRRPERRRQHE